MNLWDWIARKRKNICKYCGKKLKTKKNQGCFIHGWCGQKFDSLPKERQTKLMKRYYGTWICPICNKPRKFKRGIKHTRRCDGCGMIN